MNITKASKLSGKITIPGDKSISHRTIMLGALANGTTEVTNFLQGADCLSTIDCFKKMGIEIENSQRSVVIRGKGLNGLQKPSQILDAGNSGTTTRIMSGILAAQPFESKLTGDTSIQRRPMGRIIEPLSQMGAFITSINQNGCAPLSIHGRNLTGIHYQSKVASAQVKSAILLAGLFAEGQTSVTEPYVSRNHTEIMLNYFGGDIHTNDTTATVTPNPKLIGQQVTVPGDISSAAYFIAAGLIVPNSEILIQNVGINPTRNGIIRVCQEMGGNITLLNMNSNNGEQTADILVKSSDLKGIEIGGKIIPTLIDELPIISVLACFAKGETIIKDAAELKVKESNRLDVCVNHLSAMNADVTATEDGMIIKGGRPLHGALLDSKLDHRIAMSFAIAGLIADGTTTIERSDCVDISYPTFYSDLRKLQC